MAVARKIKTLLTVNILVFVGIILFSVYCRIQDRSEEIIQMGRMSDQRLRARNGRSQVESVRDDYELKRGASNELSAQRSLLHAFPVNIIQENKSIMNLPLGGNPGCERSLAVTIPP
ncbi:hypothetical protein KUCAC02_024776, partial [Chaenocephalus aceratus]